MPAPQNHLPTGRAIRRAVCLHVRGVDESQVSVAVPYLWSQLRDVADNVSLAEQSTTPLTGGKVSGFRDVGVLLSKELLLESDTGRPTWWDRRDEILPRGSAAPLVLFPIGG